MEEVQKSLLRFQPELALVAGLLLVVIVDATRIAARNAINRGLTAVSLIAALYLCGGMVGPVVAGGPIFSGMMVVDPMGAFFKALLIAASLLILLAFTFENSKELHGLGQGEFYALLLAVTFSNALLSGANDLAMIYLALEMVSITSYVMVAYMKGDRLSNEASLKYILFGAVSTGAMVYGLSLLYGLTGSTSVPAIRTFLAQSLANENQFALYVIALLIFAGFGFKTAAVPFHFWCPDVYQGAPTPVTAFLSVAPKAAGFAIMTRFFFGGMSSAGAREWDLTGSFDWPSLLMVVSVMTMTLGNVAALTQTNMKRLLAYSSIAHAGYIMMGVVALSDTGLRGIMIYLAAYLVMNLGAFLVVTLIHRHEGSFDLRDYPGMFRRAPLLTFAMAIFLLSLMGIPPLVGFMGKLYVFGAIVERGPEYWWFAVVGAVNAAIAACYYARILRTMTIDEEIVSTGGTPRPAIQLPFADVAWLWIFVAGNVLPLLVAWTAVDGWAKSSLVFWAGR
jgi:NADH-quinone oxidoreductase subunit N